MPGMGVRAGLEYPEGNSGGLMTAASRLSSLAALVAAEADGIARAGQVGGWEGRRYASFQAAQSALVDERFKVETFGNPLAAAFQKASLRHLLGGKGLPFSAWPPIRTVMAWI